MQRVHSGLIITNLNASGIQTLNLPPAVAGMRFIFALSAAQRITVNPDNNDLFIGLVIRKVGTWTNTG